MRAMLGHLISKLRKRWKGYTLAAVLALFVGYLRDLIKALVEDRVIGLMNSFLDNNALGIWQWLKPHLIWLADHPWLLFVLCLCGIFIHAYLESRQRSVAPADLVSAAGE